MVSVSAVRPTQLAPAQRSPLRWISSDAPAGLAEAVADRADRLDEVRVLLAELGSETSDVDVDRASAAVVLVAPHTRQQRLAGEHLARMRRQVLEELVLHVGEVERATRDRGLVGLEVEHEHAVLDELGTRPSATSPEQVLEPRFELDRGRRRDAEVVEEVLTQLEVADVRRGDEKKEWFERDVALAEHAAQAERRFGVARRVDHRARPALLGLDARRQDRKS